MKNRPYSYWVFGISAAAAAATVWTIATSGMGADGPLAYAMVYALPLLPYLLLCLTSGLARLSPWGNRLLLAATVIAVGIGFAEFYDFYISGSCMRGLVIFIAPIFQAAVVVPGILAAVITTVVAKRLARSPRA